MSSQLNDGFLVSAQYGSRIATELNIVSRLPFISLVIFLLALPSSVRADDGGPTATAGERLASTARGLFDPGVLARHIATMAMNPHDRTSLGAQYVRTLADHDVSRLATVAIASIILHEDSQYDRAGHGGIVRRAAYAFSRSFVTHTDDGTRAINLAEFGGTALAATAANLYYDASQRSLQNTLHRWQSQLLWDAVSNEAKEFWPDVQHRLHRR